MKKSIIILLSVLGMTMSLSANAQNVSNITIGVLGGSNIYIEPTFSNNGSTWAFIPGGSVFLDATVVNFGKGHFTVGAQTGYQYWGNSSATLGGKLYDFAVAPRLTVGWNLAKWFELHVGLTAGLGISNWRGAKDVNMGFSYSGFVGTEFFLSDHFGLMLETGYSDYTPDANVGFVFRF